MKRRDFLKTTTLAAGAAFASRYATIVPAAEATTQPNILWFSTEDISPDLGCYGDKYAISPNTDKFSNGAVRYDHAYAHMGVCAPARSGIITGMYPTSMGTNHMRCRGVPQPFVKCFTEYLRAAGYWCTNRSKTDYQFESPFTAWDTGRNNWKDRAEGQPFFSVINYTGTHESKARSKPDYKGKHDPAQAVLPPYYPDTPNARLDWAKYHDNITVMDDVFQKVLDDLKADGLADDTIVWFWGDHGRGLPRGKRWIYDSGLKIPLMIYVPEKLLKWASPDDPKAVKPGTACDELVSFIDFAPTMLSLCGVKVPDHIQGQAFLGPQKAKPRKYIHAARDRVDEAYDIIRAVRDKKFKYLRNFMPWLTRALDVDYMNQMPTMRDMRRLAAEGKLKGPQMQYFEPTKPVEELYDCTKDPHEINNLAADPKYADDLKRLRAECVRWMKEVGDFGLMPEGEFDMLKRPNDQYESTSAPGISPEGETAVITCNTPGASIGYQISGGGGGAAASADTSGAIFMPAGDAKINGGGAKKNSDHISSWRDSKTWLSWEVKVPKAGKYPVHVVQSNGGNAGSKYVMHVGDKTLDGTVKSTGGWTNFETITVGEIEVAKAGKITVAIKPVVKDGPYCMNVRGVMLGGKAAAAATKSGEGKKKSGGGGWQVYSKPIPVVKGQTITAKAIRIGFKESKQVTWKAGDAKLEAVEAKTRTHWKETVDKSGMLERILQVKAVDGDGEKAIPTYIKFLKDPVASVRYWSIVGLREVSGDAIKKEKDKYAGIFRECLKDKSPACRVAAAQGLCDLGLEAEGVPALCAVLKDGPTSSMQLLAATAICQIGDKAKPAIEVLKGKFSGYPARMNKHTLTGLGEKAPAGSGKKRDKKKDRKRKK